MTKAVSFEKKPKDQAVSFWNKRAVTVIKTRPQDPFLEMIGRIASNALSNKETEVRPLSSRIVVLLELTEAA